MISVGLEFEGGNLDGVLRAFLSLPSSLRPTHFSDDETDSRRRISVDNLREFKIFLHRRDAGFFLFVIAFECFVSVARRKAILINCSINEEAELAKNFLIHMASAFPIFGFSCAPEEREYRNRVTTLQGVNSIESWVGRDTEKYVPDFYWLTLLPVALAQKHNIPISIIEEVALDHMKIKFGQHLSRFYEQPEDWRLTNAVADLCSSISGVLMSKEFAHRS